ncbi:MAG: Dipeptidyl-peptidase 5 [Gemmatimonadaceae bacterium]|nr:Dipeptidyl-peptidase 5 [Gemmatimonadaceae bacterium]
MMHLTRRLLPGAAWLSLTFTGVPGQAQRVMSYADFAALNGISDPQVSPDGGAVLYSVRTTDMDANRRSARTFVVAAAGGSPRMWPNDSVAAAEARWSPDGTMIAFTTGGQLWVANADGSAPRRLTDLNGGASGPVWAGSGDRIAFVSVVYPECRTDRCNKERDDARASNKVKAHVADRLLYRHWNAWDENTRSHLFVVGLDGSAPRDLTPGASYDVPPGPFGGSEGYAFAPDGRELAYTAKDVGRDAAWSTDASIFVVSVDGGPPTNITPDNRGGDQNPVYSADGRHIAYASQARAGFESDRWRLMLYDRSARESRELSRGWDRNAESYFFAPDSRSVFVGTADQGRSKLFELAIAAGGPASAPRPVVEGHNNTAFSLSKDGRTLVWMRDAADRPGDVWIRTSGVTPAARTRSTVPPAVVDRQLTHENDALLSQLTLHAAEDFWFAGAKGDSIHGFVLKPPQWTSGGKFPVILLIHGGPQGAWLDSWSGRWSYELFAATGAAVVAINPRGSTGYGQRITDEVSRDWGGKVYEDLMKGLDAALIANPWMDSTRMGAAGGSFGGYMVNWMLGHTSRFKAFVSHAGVFNLENMYGATEEIWFPEWEYGGPYWNPTAMTEQYRRFSPHLFAGNFRTPTLVLHGELDYRVPYYEGISLFTALQRQGVPSRLVVYPDEGHWILKPQNHRLWMAEVQTWLQKYLSSGKPTSD